MSNFYCDDIVLTGEVAKNFIKSLGEPDVLRDNYIKEIKETMFFKEENGKLIVEIPGLDLDFLKEFEVD